MPVQRLLILAAVWAGWTPQAGGQTDASARAFVDQTRIAAARLADLHDAIAAGYRAVGPELPAMGQHWVNPGLLNGGGIDPTRPQVLEYVTIGGHPTLVGVAYAVLLGPNQAAPNHPVSSHLWHAHGGDLDEESLADSHAGSGAADSDRMAVLHVWVPQSNPAGTFAAENWTLPFLRAGFEPPSGTPDPSGRALALGTGALTYFLAQVRAHMAPDSADDVTMTATLTAVADSVARWRAGRAPGGALAPAEVTWLADLWHSLHAWLPDPHHASRH